MNRRSAEGNMDSHGSSLTNSSKQDDDDLDADIDVDDFDATREASNDEINSKTSETHSKPLRNSTSNFNQTLNYTKLVILKLFLLFSFSNHIDCLK